MKIDQLFETGHETTPQLAKRLRWALAHDHEAVILANGQLWAATWITYPDGHKEKEWDNLTNISTPQFKQWLGY